ncbi:isoleucine-tRNA ligase [Scheffersomyces spartinae]|uniref:isoleucine--tRNA ligase n=1 Tax=Scheffersomyces spartinae TaxID=45513 RepID=A0A9P7VDJ2_9ASCO|nr:isoleucine-tRNA ligase [Scheffersomyces spartinae]KAG7195869.1 isoleucine-tRNA ligase [Scheffersomyces spartinae]
MLRLSRTLATSCRAFYAQKKILYSSTLHLPKTSFGPKIPTGEEAKSLIKKSSEEVYQWQMEHKKDCAEFILHDGPPYANGDLHLGHALNKILKDIINRFELIHENKRVLYRTGWDCHGLPIEMKVIQATDPKKVSLLTPAEIRSKCREWASLMIEKQRHQFGEFAIMSDMSDPYVTMDHKYEIKQLLVFRKLVENGLLSRQLKPVWWGCETQTALAEAELEYNNEHRSVAIHVQFPLSQLSNQQLQSIVDASNSNIQVTNPHLLIWTSTPWTIPANKAVCVHSNLTYTLVHNPETNIQLLVAQNLVDDICKYNEQLVVLPVSIPGEKLLSLTYFNPARGTNDTEVFPVLHGDHVSDSAGSGLVHTAPAHGGEDFLIGIRHVLPISSSVDHRGCFIAGELAPGFLSLAGKKVTESATVWDTIKVLDENNMIFHINKKFMHSYPYDWRSNKPVIQRATPQWFVNVEKIKETAIEALNNVSFIPESGKNRLPSFVRNRNEWCISRQRTWGVPLPIVYSKETGEPLEGLEVMDHIIKKIDEYGTDEWFVQEDNISRWLPNEYNGEDFIKCKDTMDVWFDSGTSWTTLGDNLDSLAASEKPLADIYLEGSDQHRGWFQSSLLNKVISSGSHGEGFKPVAPFKKIITHGFTLDKMNVKMSKSKGNTITPSHAITGGGKPFLPSLGTDGLRLWAASSLYTSDVSVSPEILSRVFENVKKLRVTFKFLLGNLNGFDPAQHGVLYDKLNPLDKWSLARLYKLQQDCIEFYKDHNFQKVVRAINTHISTDLSATYFDISKDCLYTDFEDSHRRRCIQTVLETILKTYIGILAPIQPILTQEVWTSYKEEICAGKIPESPFMVTQWEETFKLPKFYENEAIQNDFNQIWKIRDVINKNLESLRLQGSFKNKLETQVNLVIEDETIMNELQPHASFLDDHFLVSKVNVNLDSVTKEGLKYFNETEVCLDGGRSLKVQIFPSDDSKCPRCWKFVSPVPETLCPKCDSVVN